MGKARSEALGETFLWSVECGSEVGGELKNPQKVERKVNRKGHRKMRWWGRGTRRRHQEKARASPQKTRVVEPALSC